MRGEVVSDLHPNGPFLLCPFGIAMGPLILLLNPNWELKESKADRSAALGGFPNRVLTTQVSWAARFLLPNVRGSRKPTQVYPGARAQRNVLTPKKVGIAARGRNALLHARARAVLLHTGGFGTNGLPFCGRTSVPMAPSAKQSRSPLVPASVLDTATGSWREARGAGFRPASNPLCAAHKPSACIQKQGLTRRAYSGALGRRCRSPKRQVQGLPSPSKKTSEP